MSASSPTFTPLTLTVPPQPSFPHSATHTIYIRPSDPSNPNPDTDRSAFLANIPVDATEENLRGLFKRLGGARVARLDGLDGIHQRPAFTLPGNDESERLSLLGPTGGHDGGKRTGKKRKRGDDDLATVLRVADAEEAKLPETWARDVLRSGSSAVIVFVDGPSRDAAMKAVRRAVKKKMEVTWPVTGVEEGAWGEKRYRTHHTLTYPSKSSLQSRVNSYLTAFAAVEAARKRAAARTRAQPDEEGFITVTRGGRTGPARAEEAEKAREREQEKNRKRTAEADFYRFQGRERRKQREVELKRGFQEDLGRLRGKASKPL